MRQIITYLAILPLILTNQAPVASSLESADLSSREAEFVIVQSNEMGGVEEAYAPVNSMEIEVVKAADMMLYGSLEEQEVDTVHGKYILPKGSVLLKTTSDYEVLSLPVEESVNGVVLNLGDRIQVQQDLALLSDGQLILKYKNQDLVVSLEQRGGQFFTIYGYRDNKYFGLVNVAEPHKRYLVNYKSSQFISSANFQLRPAVVVQESTDVGSASVQVTQRPSVFSSFTIAAEEESQEPEPQVRGEQELSEFAQSYAEQIQKGEAVETYPGVVSFYNQRLSSEARVSLEIERDVRDHFLNSDELYLCVNNDLSGFPEEIDKDKVSLKRSLDPIRLVEGVEPIEITKSGHVYKYLRFIYDGTEYWGLESIRNVSSGVETGRFIATFSDCPKIQGDLLQARLASEVANQEVDQVEGISITSAESFVRYTCPDSGRVNAYPSKSLSQEGKIQINKGSEIMLLQGADSEEFVASNGYTYVHIQYEGETYWAAKDFIKTYESCPSIQSESVVACVNESLNYYAQDSDLADTTKAAGQFSAFVPVYRFYGHVFDRKITTSPSGNVITYVPVKKDLESEEIFWVAEDYVPKTCGLNPTQEISYTSSQGLTCKVRQNDNFPYASHSAKFDYRTGSTMFNAGRSGGRRHAATDLYSYYRGASTALYGSRVYAIDDAVVSGKGTWGRTEWIMVQSRHGYSWNYGEVGRVQVRNRQAINRGQRIGTAKKYVRGGSTYPAMLHLEKYAAHISNPSTDRSRRTQVYRRNRHLVNPTCHVEYMSKRKFGKIWDGE